MYDPNKNETRTEIVKIIDAEIIITQYDLTREEPLFSTTETKHILNILENLKTRIACRTFKEDFTLD